MSSYVSITVYYSRDGRLMAYAEDANGRRKSAKLGWWQDEIEGVLGAFGAELPVFVDKPAEEVTP